MEFNESNLKKIRGLIIFTIVAVVVGVNYTRVLAVAGNIFRIITPFLLGAAIAFILNVPMRKIEKVLGMRADSKLRRPLSVLLTVMVVVGVVLLVIVFVIPQLFDTLMSLQNSIPAFLMSIQRDTEALFVKYPEIVNYINSIQMDWEQVFEGILSFLTAGAGSVISSTFSAAMSIVSGVTTFGIAFIFSMYILLQKETLSRQIKKLIKAFFSEQLTSQIISIAAMTERTFSNFLAGQCVEAVVLGTMFFITLSIFRMPYALLIGVLIAFTALIPVFGAFIGCAVGIFLILMVSPVQALVFLVIFFVLQQIEGNLIYPHVVGNSVGLPSIWVLVAVTIGGSAMGIAGMLIFIPLCSVIYALMRGIVNVRLEKKYPKVESVKKAEKE